MTSKQVRERMQALGVYRPEYDGGIETYAGMCKQYKQLMRKTKDDENWYIEQTDHGTKKSALAGTLESLRKDMLQYENALGLTPAGLKKIMDKAPKKSTGGLANLGRKMGSGAG